MTKLGKSVVPNTLGNSMSAGLGPQLALSGMYSSLCTVKESHNNKNNHKQ